LNLNLVIEDAQVTQKAAVATTNPARVGLRKGGAGLSARSATSGTMRMSAAILPINLGADLTIAQRTPG
jgi:hypothetical protein